jgi:hypothetical protein
MAIAPRLPIDPMNSPVLLPSTPQLDRARCELFFLLFVWGDEPSVSRRSQHRASGRLARRRK